MFGDNAVKDEAVYLALAGVESDAIQAVASALADAIPARLWNPRHALDPALAAEENIEHGRAVVVRQLYATLERRARQHETP